MPAPAPAPGTANVPHRNTLLELTRPHRRIVVAPSPSCNRDEPGARTRPPPSPPPLSQARHRWPRHYIAGTSVLEDSVVSNQRRALALRALGPASTDVQRRHLR